MARGRPRRSSCSLAPRRWSSRLIDPRGLVMSTVPCTVRGCTRSQYSVAEAGREGGREEKTVVQLGVWTAFHSPFSPTRAIGAGVGPHTGRRLGGLGRGARPSRVADAVERRLSASAVARRAGSRGRPRAVTSPFSHNSVLSALCLVPHTARTQVARSHFSLDSTQ